MNSYGFVNSLYQCCHLQSSMTFIIIFPLDHNGFLRLRTKAGTKKSIFSDPAQLPVSILRPRGRHTDWKVSLNRIFSSNRTYSEFADEPSVIVDRGAMSDLLQYKLHKNTSMEDSFVVQISVKNFEFSRKTHSWELWHFCMTSNGNKLRMVTSWKKHLQWCFEIKWMWLITISNFFQF